MGRWVDNIKMDIKEIGWDDVYWIHLTQDRVQWPGVVHTVHERSGQLKGGKILGKLNKYYFLKKD